MTPVDAPAMTATTTGEVRHIAASTAEVDGRSLRRAQSYDRAVDALLDLLLSGNPAPTAQEIAAHSGISIRTVFRLTDDIEALHAAAVSRQMERTAHLYAPIPDTGSLSTRARRLVQNRVGVFDKIAPIRRVADRLAATSERIADGVALHHLALRAQVAELFEPELTALAPHRRGIALEAADTATAWETWDQLRRSKGLSNEAAAKVMGVLLLGAIDAA